MELESTARGRGGEGDVGLGGMQGLGDCGRGSRDPSLTEVRHRGRVLGGGTGGPDSLRSPVKMVGYEGLGATHVGRCGSRFTEVPHGGGLYWQGLGLGSTGEIQKPFTHGGPPRTGGTGRHRGRR